MKRKSVMVAVIVMLFVGTSTLAGVHTPVFQRNEQMQRESTVLSFDAPSIHIEENHMYSVIEANGDMEYLMQEGAPIVPYKTAALTFPAGTKIEHVEATPSAVHTMHLEKPLQRAPEPLIYGAEYHQVDAVKGIVHRETELYPSDWISYHIGAGIRDGTHLIILSIQFYPVRYLPSTNEIYHVTEIDVDITYELPSRPLFTNDAYDMVIIAPSAFSDTLQPLVDRKEQYGIATKLVTLDEIYDGAYFPVQGRDDAEKVKYFIKDAIEEWGIQYVMLVGGRERGAKLQWWCPVRYTNLDAGDGDKQFLSDLYFSDIYKYEDGELVFEDWDGNGNGIFGEWNYKGKDTLDMYPDVYIGRLACRTLQELTIVVQKILVYEATAHEGTWSKKYVGIGGDTFPGDQWYDGEESVSKVMEYLDPLGYECTPLFTSDGSLSSGGDIIDAINEGCGLLEFEGHGTPTSWATHKPQSGEWDVYINEIQFLLLKNKNMYPVCVVGGCSNSKFDITLFDLLDFKNLSAIIEHGSAGPKSFSWWLVSKKDGGSIATIGCTSYGYGKSGDADHDGIFDGIQYRGGFIDIEFFRVYAQEGKDILGEAHAEAITNYLIKFPPMTNLIDGKTVEEWCLFGDPSLKMGGYS
ncbi:MAG: peptidase C25 [Thermoplasmata archaeon]|nr:MAG: peptidase C25 [Thermoplasmata archaeon]